MIEIIKNLDFKKIKDKGAPLAIAGACFVAVFIAGFGTGRISNGGASDSPAKRSLSNSTTNTGDKTKTTAAGATDGAGNSATASTQNSSTTKLPATTTTGAVDPNNCYIKGSKSKTYHMPGGSFYERTNPAACFNSEEEAVAAGYKKSSR